MLKIWGRANSSNVQKVLWCCEELGIEFDRVDAGGHFGLTKEPVYLAMNPNGLVPTIKDGDAILWESNTILRYLACTRGAEHLFPADPVRRAQVERWMDWQLASLMPPMATLLWGYYRTAPNDRDQTALDEAQRRATLAFSILENLLSDRRYIAGQNFTLADICLGIFVYRWHLYPVDRLPMPHLKRLNDLYCERSGFRTHVIGPIT